MCSLVQTWARWLATLVLMAGLCGCSSFHRDWKRATSTNASPAGSVEGAWEGTWVSKANGHHGRLRCLLTPTGPTGQTARFRATYGGIFSFEYSVPLEMKPSANGQTFQGSANLGWLAGGEYHYEGTAETSRLYSTYTSKADHGIFELTRPTPARPPTTQP